MGHENVSSIKPHSQLYRECHEEIIKKWERVKKTGGVIFQFQLVLQVTQLLTNNKLRLVQL